MFVLGYSSAKRAGALDAPLGRSKLTLPPLFVHSLGVRGCAFGADSFNLLTMPALR